MRVVTKTLMIFTLAVLLSSFYTEAAAQQVQSDYQILQDFKKEYRSISNNLKEVTSTGEMEKLMKEIKTLDTNYSDHARLLNKALYPESYQEEVEELKKRAVTIQHRLATIKRQDEKIEQLNQQLSSYDSKLDTLTNRTDSLRATMQKSSGREKRLSAMVRQYRKSLEQRDDLILSFVDSIMIGYTNLDIQSIQNLENTRKKARFNAEGNALKMIQNIARENVEFLNSNPALSAGEYLRMKSVQQEFESMWSKIGDKLVEIYADGQEKRAAQSISHAITEWDQKITAQTWASLNQAFDKRDIAMPKFNSPETFYTTLNRYIEESLKASWEGWGIESDFETYQKFYSFWTEEVQTIWAPYLEKGNILSNKQMASIDRQLDEWESNAQPESNVLVYLLGASVLMIVALGVMLAREKTNHA